MRRSAVCPAPQRVGTDLIGSPIFANSPPPHSEPVHHRPTYFCLYENTGWCAFWSFLSGVADDSVLAYGAVTLCIEYMSRYPITHWRCFIFQKNRILTQGHYFILKLSVSTSCRLPYRINITHSAACPPTCVGHERREATNCSCQIKHGPCSLHLALQAFTSFSITPRPTLPSRNIIALKSESLRLQLSWIFMLHSCLEQ